MVCQVQQVILAPSQPLALKVPGTLRAMPVPARVVRLMPPPAMLALPLRRTQAIRAANRQLLKHPVPRPPEQIPMLIQILAAELPKDLARILLELEAVATGNFDRMNRIDRVSSLAARIEVMAPPVEGSSVLLLSWTAQADPERLR